MSDKTQSVIDRLWQDVLYRHNEVLGPHPTEDEDRVIKDVCTIAEAAVREAVEAERGRQVAEKAELHVLLGKLVKDACAVGGSPELSPDDWKRACLLSGHYCEPYLSAFPTTDSEGTG